jgi:nicotinamidase-related amidase
MIRGLERGQRPALVISECQRGVLDPELAIFAGLAQQCARRGVLGHIATLAGAFRDAGHPVVHAHVAIRPDLGALAVTNPISARTAREKRMLAGTPEVDAMPEVAPAPDDYISSRQSGLGMWYGTDLDSTLRNLRVETVVFAGVSTNLAIFAGAVGAVDRGYQAVVPTDAVAGASADAHDWMVTNTLPLLASMTTTDAVGAVVRAAQA